MDRTHDLDTDEICSEIMMSDESKITPRLRAEFVGVIVTWEGIRRLPSYLPASLLLRP